MFQLSLSTVKDVADIAQSIAVFCVAVGGAWLYLRRRQRFPRAKMSHDVRHKRVSDQQTAILVIVTIANLGEVIIRLKKGFSWIRQITPANDFLAQLTEENRNRCDMGWGLLTEKRADCEHVEIEPNEEQEFCFDFLVDSDVQTVSIYSHFENERKTKRKLGWNKTTWYDLTS